MTSTILRVAALVIIIVMIASIGVYATIGLRNRPSQATETMFTKTRGNTEVKKVSGGTLYRTTITNGTMLKYLWFISYINSSLKKPKTSNMTVTLTILGSEGPWIKVNMTVSNQTQSVSYPYGSILLPKDLLGRNEVSVPLYTGVGRSCVTLRLEGSEVVDGKEAYVYVGSIKQLSYSIKLKLYYSKKDGVMLKMESFMKIFPLANVYVEGNLTLELIEMKTSNGNEIDIILPNSFMCLNSVSSDLRLTSTGIYEIANGTVEDVNDMKLKNALNTFALVAVLDKECPHCQRFWPILLEAANETKVDVYVVVVSRSEIMTEAIYNIAYKKVMEPLIRQGNFGVPFLGVFKNGTLITYRLGEQTLDEVENFIISAETHIAK